MDIILMAGLWLERSVWDDVCSELERRGHRAIAVALPGADDGSAEATLDDQVEAALEAVDGTEHPLVVGHSAASTLAWIMADRRPTAIAGAVMIGGFPSSDGSTYADFFPLTDGVMAFPGWEAFEGPDSDDLDGPARERLAAGAVPVAGAVARGIVHLTDERRYDVPVTLICPEFDPEQARAWIEAGDVPELARTPQVSYVDIDSGHWPMVTRPAELAGVLDGIARGSIARGSNARHPDGRA
jgi:pimeloyl-ACP methyl ester carboxylesterase